MVTVQQRGDYLNAQLENSDITDEAQIDEMLAELDELAGQEADAEWLGSPEAIMDVEAWLAAQPDEEGGDEDVE